MFKSFIILLVVLFSTCNLHSKDSKFPEIKDGVLDLSTWDFESKGLVNLNGDWEFYWKKILTPRQLNRGKYKPTAYFPYSTWKKKTAGGVKLNEFGYATYRMKIILPDAETPMAIKIPEVLSAHKLYVNGKLITKSGVVGRKKNKEKPAANNTFGLIVPKTNELEVVLNISNYHYRDRGQNRTILFGKVDQIDARRLYDVSMDVFIIGSILIMGLYHIGLYLIRRKHSSPLYFGIFCLVVGARTIAVGKGDFIYILSPETSFKTEKFLEFMGFLIGMGAFTSLAYALFPKQIWKRNHIVQWVVGGILTAVFLAVPPLYYPKLVRIFHLCALIGIIMMIIGVTKAVKIKKSGSILFLLGLLSVSGSAINDMLLARKVINTIPMSHYGLFLYIFIQATAIFRLFSKTFTQVEVSEKTIRTMNVELIEKEKARTLFFHNTSHELRTPLNGIIGYAQLINKGNYGEINEKVKGQVFKIVDLANSLKYQVNSILDLAKAKRGELRLCNSLIPLNEIVEISCSLSEGIVLSTDGLSFKLQTSWEQGNPPKYINDKDKVVTIIRNLLSNSFKFKDPTRENKVKLQLDATEDKLTITVVDTGIGIPEQQTVKIFNEFEQVDSDATRKYEGTGLGLAMVKSITEVMHGRIVVKSIEGQGTTIKVELPSQKDIHTVQSDSTFKPEVKKEDKFAKDHGFDTYVQKSTLDLKAEKSYNILIVDDNEVNLDVISEILSSSGYPVVTASGGAMALEMVRKSKPDLMVLDLMMPEVSGEDVLRELKQDKELKEIPVVLLTARASEEDRILGLNMGADDYLSKPVVADEVLLRVKNLLHRIDYSRERAQTTLLEKQSAVVRSLLELGTHIQFVDKLDDFLGSVLIKLKELFSERQFALSIEDPNTDRISMFVSESMEEHHCELIKKKTARVICGHLSSSRKKEGHIFGSDIIKMKELFEEEDHSITWTMLGGQILGQKGEAKELLNLKLYIRGFAFTDHELDTLRVFIDQVIGATRNKMYAKKLNTMAHTDNLTGAFNRAYFVPLFKKEVEEVKQRESHIFSLISCDLNRLKYINDTFGHDEGDIYIITAYNVLNQAVGKKGVVARYGGDEFQILLPNTSAVDADEIIKRIRGIESDSKLTFKNPETGQDEDLQIAFSLGMASSEQHESDNIMKQADLQMYKDKEKWYTQRDKG